ncbi:MAG: hypothetical protein WAN93_02790 [Solirubrobacteraceae bacterium]
MLMTVGLFLSAVVAIGSLTTGVSVAGMSSGVAARTFTMSESSNLHLTSRQGFRLNEHGSASGTVTGTIYVHLTIVSTSRVTAEVNIYPHGGSISGYASAKYQRGTSTGAFSGSISINRGTGKYNHVHGKGLSFSGTIARSNYAITVHVNGTVSD